jgi:hypothetical protein
VKKDVDYEKLCSFINSTIKQKSLIFLIGDFYGDVKLSNIAYKNELYAIVVRDRFEEYPIFDGEYELIDPVDFSNSSIDIDKQIAKNYQQLVKQNDKKWQNHFIKHKIQSGKIYTSDDIYIRLSQILKG